MQAIGSLIFGRSDNKENNNLVDVVSASDNPSKLVSFVNKNNVISCVNQLKDNLPSNAIVISMVGNSRRGKSMFLNCMISYLLDENVKAFDFKTIKESSSSDVTNGIDYYVYKSKGRENNVEYIFLDVQGIGGVHSAADPHVLLLIYEISDIVIVNIDRSINNSSLELLSPINSMAHRMNARQIKPKLLFRIYDSDEYDEKIATANYNNVFSKKQDQVEGIRNNIRELFDISDKYIVWTETPSKQQKATKDLLSLLADSDLLFKQAIKKTFDIINTTKKTYKEHFGYKLKASISKINGFNVGGRDFDNVNRYVIDEMLKWLGEYPGNYNHKIDQRLLTEIFITQGTKTEYDNFIEPILQLADKTIEEFKKEFNKAPEDAFGQMLEKLNRKIKHFVSKAEQKSIELGKHLIDVSPKYNSLISGICQPYFNNNKGITPDVIDKYAALQEYLNDTSDHISPIAKHEYKKELNLQFSEIVKIFDKEKTDYDNKTAEAGRAIIKDLARINNDVIGNIAEFIKLLEMNYDVIKLMFISEFANKHNIINDNELKIKTNIKTYRINYNNKKIELLYISDGVNNIGINNVHTAECVKIKNGLVELDKGLNNAKREFMEMRNAWITANIADYKSNKTPELTEGQYRPSGSGCYYSTRLSLYNQIKHNDNLVLFEMPSLAIAPPTVRVPDATHYLVSLQMMGIDVFKIRTSAEIKKLLPADAYKVYLKSVEYAKNNNLNWLSHQDMQHILQTNSQYIHLYNLLYTFYKKWFEALACK